MITNSILAHCTEKEKNFFKEFKKTKELFTESSIHDLRVASRRIISVLNFYYFVEPKKSIKKIRKEIKSLFDELNELRDIQIIIKEIQVLFETDEKWKTFLEWLEEKEEYLLKKAKKEIREFSVDKLGEKLRKKTDQLKIKYNDSVIINKLISWTDLNFSVIHPLYNDMKPDDTASIHRLRIGFKKFRYSLELLAPFYYENYRGVLESLGKYQDMLGNIQDASVIINTYKEFYQESQNNSPDFFDIRFKEAVEFYWKEKDTLFSFWERKNPTTEDEKENVTNF